METGKNYFGKWSPPKLFLSVAEDQRNREHLKSFYLDSRKWLRIFHCITTDADAFPELSHFLAKNKEQKYVIRNTLSPLCVHPTCQIILIVVFFLELKIILIILTACPAPWRARISKQIMFILQKYKIDTSYFSAKNMDTFLRQFPAYSLIFQFVFEATMKSGDTALYSLQREKVNTSHVFTSRVLSYKQKLESECEREPNSTWEQLNCGRVCSTFLWRCE